MIAVSKENIEEILVRGMCIITNTSMALTLWMSRITFMKAWSRKKCWHSSRTYWSN